MSKTYELSYTAERIDEMLKEVDEHTIYSDATTEEHGLMSATDKTKLDALPTAQQIEGSLSEKVDKVSEATSGNFAGLDSNGNITDSGKKASDFATAGALDALVDYVDHVKHIKQDVLTFDSTPTQNSTNPVTSGGVFGALIGKQDVLDFDTTPTENSAKPVVSDGIYRALEGKEDTLTFDQTPTSRSVNPVTSTGIYDALSVKADKSDTYTKSEVDAKVTSVMRYKGSVNNYAALSAIQNPSVGDVYNVLDTGHNYAYDGTSWDVLSGIVSVDGKADKVSNATNGNFAGLDANGNITDSGSKASDFATASQGAKADTAYQKPQTGIPETDLSSDVQSQLNKHFKGWYESLNELKAAHTATEGDSAYVKDASPATTWSIYEYDATAESDNYWADSGTDADTSNVQTFASGEEVNEVHIVNELVMGGTEDVLSAEQGKRIGSEVYHGNRIPITPTLINGRYIKANGEIATSTAGSGKAYNLACFPARQTKWVLHILTDSIDSSNPTGGVAFVDSVDELDAGDVVSTIRSSTTSAYSFDDDFVVPAGKIAVVSEYRYSTSWYNYYESEEASKVGNLSELTTLDKDNIVSAVSSINDKVITIKQTELADYNLIRGAAISRNIVQTGLSTYYKLAYFQPNQTKWYARVIANVSESNNVLGGSICLVDSISELVADALIAPVVPGKSGTQFTVDSTVEVPAGKILVVAIMKDYYHIYKLEADTSFAKKDDIDNLLYENLTIEATPTKIYGRYLDSSNIIKQSTAGGGNAFNIAYFQARESDWKAEIVANNINGSARTGAIAFVDSIDELDIDDEITDIVVASHASSVDYSMDEVVEVPAGKILVVFEMNYGTKVFNYYEVVGRRLVTDRLSDEIQAIGNPDYIGSNPLEIIKETAGYTSIFRKMGMIGGSMASGSHHVDPYPVESKYEYSPLQFMARLCGSDGFNFTYGGASARGWIGNTSKGGSSTYFSENPTQMYILQLGNNDSAYHSEHPEYVLGTTADLAGNNGVWADTYFGHMGEIINKIRTTSPNSYLFLCTFYKGYGSSEGSEFDYNQAIRDIAEYYTANNGANRPEGDSLHYYLLDYHKYGKHYGYFNSGIHAGTVQGSHLVGTGYLLTAYQFCTYIDWIIKNNMADFNEVALILDNNE